MWIFRWIKAKVLFNKQMEPCQIHPSICCWCIDLSPFQMISITNFDLSLFQMISITNFEGEERTRVKQMISSLGAKYTGYMTRSNSVLVCKRWADETFSFLTFASDTGFENFTCLLPWQVVLYVRQVDISDILKPVMNLFCFYLTMW